MNQIEKSGGRERPSREVMRGLEMLVGRQHRDVHQITDLGYVKEVRAKDQNFGITFLEVLYGTVELMSFLRKM